MTTRTNHRLNARVHNEPPCFECGAARGEACVDDHGRVRAPHRIRGLVSEGALIVIRREDALARRKLRALIELVAGFAVGAIRRRKRT